MKFILIIFLVFLVGWAGWAAKDPYEKNARDNPRWEPRTFQCSEHRLPLPFTLGYYSDPSKRELKDLCKCIHGEIPVIDRDSFVRAFGKAVKKCKK